MKTKVVTIEFSQYKYQLLAAICVNIIAFAHGAAIGWLSPVLLLLQSDESPLSSGKVSVSEASWLGAIFCLGGMFGNFFFGFVAGTWGRKKALLLLAIPQISFWLTIILADNLQFIYFARVCAGMAGGGTFVTIPLFISDIAHKDVRGSLGSFLLFGVNLGTVVGFVIGAYLKYALVPLILIAIPIVFFISVIFLPETPQCLLIKNNEEDAKKSLRFYRNLSETKSDDQAIFNLAFEELKSSLNISSNSNIKTSKFSFHNLDKNKVSKCIGIGIGIVSANILSGCFAIINYTSAIFKQSGSTMDPNTCSIVVAVSQLLGTYVSTLLVDRFGRIVLITVSVSGTALGLAVTGLYSLMSKEYDLTFINWLPVSSLSFAIFTASIALLPLTFVVLAEVLPQEIRPIGSSFCNFILNVLAFGQLKLLPILLILINVYGVMWICSFICIIGAVFYCTCVPETKGKSI